MENESLNLNNYNRNKNLLLKDKRPSHLWTTVLFINAILFSWALFGEEAFDNFFYFKILNPALILVFSLLSIIPTWISRSNIKYKNILGYIPLLLFIPIIAIIIKGLTCTGEWCGMVILYAYIIAPFAIIPPFFYLLSTISVKLPSRFIQTLMWVSIVLESVIVIWSAIVYLIYYLN